MKQCCDSCYFRQILDNETFDCLSGNGAGNISEMKAENDCEDYTEN
jgi:hypothetical protein